MIRQETLFTRYDLRSLLAERESKMFDEIDTYNGDRLLNTSPTDLAAYFSSKYCIEPVEILHDSIEVSQTESTVDARHLRGRIVIDRSRPVPVPAVTVTFKVPYLGDSKIFHCRGSTFSLAPPRAQVISGALRIAVTRADGNTDATEEAEAIRQHFDRELAAIRECLDWNDQLLRPFNESLEAKALEHIDRRRKRLLANQNLVANLGFPLRQHKDAATYTPPEVRRKVRATPPPASNKPFAPEPALSMRDYEHVLELMLLTARMIERSPSTFSTMSEEDLRNQFLIVLNSHYEGQATAETFNASGKTDILVRSKDRGVFIAECKIWRGPKSLLDGVNQLLSYTTWRDTKTAVVLFNRSKNVSQVVAKVPPTMKRHPQFKQEQQIGLEGGYRCLMSHADDSNRELVLTVLVIDVPGA